MKQIIFLLFTSLIPVSLMLAQDIEEVRDSGLPKDTVPHVVSVTTDEDVTIRESYYQELMADRDSFRVVENKYLDLEMNFNKLKLQYQSIKDSLCLYKKQYNDAQRQIKCLMDRTIKGDKALISMASNFIYIYHTKHIV